jgi:protoporphyrinogen/coproporphyrinogen III oxidase
MSSTSKPKRIIVIGAGITGLAAGYRLLENSRRTNTPIDLKVLEATDHIGGVIKTETHGNFLLEHGPDNFITNKPAGIDLCKRLGIENELIETNAKHRRALIVHNGKLVPIPPGFELMMPRKLLPFALSPILSWGGKLRALRERFVPCRANASDDDDESLASFVTRRFGKQVLDRLVQPLVGGIYTADPETLSLRATVPRFLDMEREHGSLIKTALVQAKEQKRKQKEAQQNSTKQSAATAASGARYSLFMALKGGMSRLTQALADELGNHLRTNTPVQCITRTASSENDTTNNRASTPAETWTITCNDGNTLTADAVLITAPSFRAADLLKPVDPNISNDLASIEYASSAVVVATYKRSQIARPLDAFGFVVPERENRPIIAGAFSSVKYAGRAPDDEVVLRAFLGGVTQAESLNQSDEKLIETATGELASLLKITGAPQLTRLRRYNNAMPQYHVGHVKKVAAIRDQLAHYGELQLAGNAYDGVGIPDCIASAHNAADQLLP